MKTILIFRAAESILNRALVMFMLFSASLPAAQFLVTINTAALNSQAGTIDIQFNPGLFPAAYEFGTARISAFQLGAGSLGSIASGPDGGVTGALPGPLALVNSDFLNGIVYNASFGNSASFLVDFSGRAYTASGQTILSTFSVSLSGSSTIAAYADLVGSSRIDVSFSSPGVTFTNAVPESATFGLSGVGLAAAIIVQRRRKVSSSVSTGGLTP